MDRSLQRRLQVSISPTFYVHLFCTKVLCAAFLSLQFGFVIFWRKIISAKAACKMLMKLASEDQLSTHQATLPGSGYPL